MSNNCYNVPKERAAFRQRAATNATKSRKRKLSTLTDTLTESEQLMDAGSLDEARRVLVRAQKELLSVQHALAVSASVSESEQARQLFRLDQAHRGHRWRPSIIYADPPWAYNNPGHKVGTRQQYDTMTDEALAAMPVPALAAEDCALLMWATMPKLESALRVMAAWGFEHKTTFCVWVKLERYMGRLMQGVGSYTRPNAEMVLLGVRGSMRTKLSKSFTRTNVLLSRPEQHSAKPSIMRTIALELFGDLPRIEIFGRANAPDWVVWGNQAPSAHAVSTQAESTALVGTQGDRPNNLRTGSEVNIVRRQAAKRRRFHGATKGAVRRGKQPSPLCDFLERYEPATILGKGEYRLLHNYASDDPDSNPLADDAQRRAARTSTNDTLPLDQTLGRDDLRQCGLVLQPTERRSATYPELTERQVVDNIELIERKQRRNAELLFSLNRNKRKRPIRCSEPPIN